MLKEIEWYTLVQEYTNLAIVHNVNIFLSFIKKLRYQKWFLLFLIGEWNTAKNCEIFCYFLHKKISFNLVILNTESPKKRIKNRKKIASIGVLSFESKIPSVIIWKLKQTFDAWRLESRFGALKLFERDDLDWILLWIRQDESKFHNRPRTLPRIWTLMKGIFPFEGK